MSNRNNVVFNVLPTSGNLAVLAKNQTIGDLAVGQIGFFDYETNLSFDSTTSPLPQQYFIARGKGNGDFRKSAGEAIQKNGTLTYTEKAYNAGQPMIVNISGFSAKCDTEYGFRVNFENSKIFRTLGNGQFSKAFFVKTPCCDDCADASDCNSYDQPTLVRMLAAEVNKDALQLVTASVYAVTEVTAAIVAGLSETYSVGEVFDGTTGSADLDLISAFNAVQPTEATKIKVGLRLTTNPMAVGTWCQVNLDFHKLLETVIVVSLLEGLNCSGSVVVSQNPIFAEGTGKNVMQKEYHASGWNGAGPYVVSDVLGMAKGNIEYLASASTNYLQFALQYTTKSEGGWLQYDHPLTTFIAVPTADTTTSNSVRTLLNLLAV